MDYEKARHEIRIYEQTKEFKDRICKIEKQLNRCLSRIEKKLIAIDCMESIEVNTGKFDELRKLGIEV